MLLSPECRESSSKKCVGGRCEPTCRPAVRVLMTSLRVHRRGELNAAASLAPFRQRTEVERLRGGRKARNGSAHLRMLPSNWRAPQGWQPWWALSPRVMNASQLKERDELSAAAAAAAAACVNKSCGRNQHVRECPQQGPDSKGESCDLGYLRVPRITGHLRVGRVAIGMRGGAFRSGFNTLKKAGDRNLHYLEGKNLLGSDGEAATDGSHPNDLGFMRYAQQYQGALDKIINPPSS